MGMTITEAIQKVANQPMVRWLRVAERYDKTSSEAMENIDLMMILAANEVIRSREEYGGRDQFEQAEALGLLDLLKLFDDEELTEESAREAVVNARTVEVEDGEASKSVDGGAVEGSVSDGSAGVAPDAGAHVSSDASATG